MTLSELEKSYRHCRGLTRRGGAGVWRGYELTAEPTRRALTVVLAWQAAAEVIVAAASDGEEAAALAQLAVFGRDTDNAADANAMLPPGPLWPALRETVSAYRLPVRCFRLALEGMFGEVSGVTCKTFDDLYRYCHRRAAATGLLFAHVWGGDGDPAVTRLMEYRAVALQLTMLVGRVHRDAVRGRVYLPREDMERFGCTVGHLTDGPADEPFLRLMQFQIERARSYFGMSQSLERHLSPESRAASWAVMQHSSLLLERIARRPAGVMGRGVRLPWSSRLGVAARVRLRREWG